MRQHRDGMMRCIKPLTYDGERLLAGVVYTCVRYDQPVVTAFPHHFEPADESDQEMRAHHTQLLQRAGLTPSPALAAVSSHRSSWHL